MFGLTRSTRPNPVEDLNARCNKLEDLVGTINLSIVDLTYQVQKLAEKLRRPKKQKRSAVQDLMPIVDRLHELALVGMNQEQLAEKFGTYTRQSEQTRAEVGPELESAVEEGYEIG
jgi:redox-regulated HSP33 family molecular chaperone